MMASSSSVVVGSDFGELCLVCCEKLERASKWIVVQNGIGIKPVDALIKICDVLQVSFEEIQGDWQFKQQRDGAAGQHHRGGREGITQALPFCGPCLSSFRAVVRLEDQLVEIRKNIGEKLDSIRDTIKRTSEQCSFDTDPRARNFRSKAILVKNSTSSADHSHRHHRNLPTAEVVDVENPAYQQQIRFQPQRPPPPPQPPQPPTHQLTFFHPNHNPAGTTHAVIYHTQEPQPPTDFSAYFDGGDDDDGGSPPPSPQNPASSSEDISQDYYQTRKPPSPPKRIPRPRPKITPSKKVATSSNSSSSRGRRRGESEYFAPITYDAQGTMLYENIPILPCPKGTPGGYICGQCNATIGSTPNSIALRKAKIHIKGFHLGAYQCPQCSRNYTSNDVLNQHLVRYHTTAKTPCPTCGKPIKGLESAMKHHQYTHMNALEKKAFIASGFKPHTNVKPDYKLPCRICSRVFPTHKKLKSHEETHIDAEFRKDYKCEQCDRAYTQKKSLDNHVLSVHSILKHGPKRTCPYCGKVMFQSKFKNHVKLHKEQKCLKCGICKRKEFARKTDLVRHEKICASYCAVRSHECDICGGMFKTRRILLSHRRAKHKGDRRTMVGSRLQEEIIYLEGEEERRLWEEVNNEGLVWVEGNVWSYQVYEVERIGEGEGWRCMTCGEEVEGEEEVKRHVREGHMGPYRCNKCTKSMKTLHEAQVHHRSEHLGLYGHECGVCGRTGIASKMIGRHMWSHRSVEEAVDKVNEGEIWMGVGKRSKQDEMVEVLRGMGEEVNIECGICGEGGWNSVGELYGHRGREHKGAKVVKVNRIREEDRKKRGRKEEGEGGREGRTCPLCGKEFQCRKYMLKHGYRVHKKRVGSLGTGGGGAGGEGGDKMRRRSKRKKEVDTSEEEEDEGEQETDDEEEENGGDAHRCDKCEESFVSFHELRVHERKEHLGRSCYSCEICGATGIPGRSIFRHRWSHRSLEEAVAAVNEGMIFPLRNFGRTDEYQRVLEGMGEEVRIECGICGEGGWGSVGELYGHRREVHKEARVKLVKNKEGVPWNKIEGEQECDVCGKLFANRKKMRTHRYKVHKLRMSDDGGRAKGEDTEEDEVVIKEEVLTSEEEDGDDREWDGGDGLRKSPRRPVRSTRLNVSYVVMAEEDEEMGEGMEVTVKQSPPSSEGEVEEEDGDEDWIVGC